MDHSGAYAKLGAVLAISGAMFAVIAWLFVQSVPLIALGISAVLVGVVSLALAHSLPEIPSEACSIILQTGLENLSSLVEEIGLASPAFYLPSRVCGGRPLALIPLHANSPGLHIRGMLPNRLIVLFGPTPQDIGLLVRTAGTTVTRFLDGRPGPSSAGLESAMASALVGRLDLADAVHVHREGERVVVEILSPRLNQGDLWIYRSLGSPLASIVATMVAEGLDRPVRIHAEGGSSRQAVIVVEPLNETV